MAAEDAGEYWIIDTKSGDPFSNSTGWLEWSFNNSGVLPTSQTVKIRTSAVETKTIYHLGYHQFGITPSTLGIYYANGNPADPWAQITFNLNISASNTQNYSYTVITYAEDSSGVLWSTTVRALNENSYATTASTNCTVNRITNWRQSYWLFNQQGSLNNYHMYRTIIRFDSPVPSGVTFNVSGKIYCGFGLGYPVPTETIITAKNANIYNFMLRQSDTATTGNKIIKAPYINSSFSLNDNTNIKAADRDRLINYLKNGTVRFL